MECCVRGYHVYKDTWNATIGEELECNPEAGNRADRYAVAVIKAGNIVGHVPKRISRYCSLFIRRGGTIRCLVTSGRQYSNDLPQGGLEIPCILKFTGQAKEIKKLIKFTCNPY